MSSDAKRASNARYLAKFKTVSVRFTQTDAVAVQSAADSAGESLNAYIVGAVGVPLHALAHGGKDVALCGLPGGCGCCAYCARLRGVKPYSDCFLCG